MNLLHLPWWGYMLAALALTHITIASVTIFLHRHQAHHALDLHPVASHFFRFWLWLTTGMVTKEWVAVHRKHHVKVETPDDPHSPQIHGVYKVLFQGYLLYRNEAVRQATLEAYGSGTPDDWLERRLYTRHHVLGIALMLGIDIVLFGAAGVAIWLTQMIWIPLFAAGVINGIGHFWGYRSFVTRDASSNILPIGVLIGGEELHNNHHAYSASAKLSYKWWEFDIGWSYILMLKMLGLARIRKIAPAVRLDPDKTLCDLATLRSIVVHRHEVLARYAKYLKRTALEEFRNLRRKRMISSRWILLRRSTKRWLKRDEDYLPLKDRRLLDQALGASHVILTIHSMRQELIALAVRSHESKEFLVQQLEDWCSRAEVSGIKALREFSLHLRSYDSSRHIQPAV